jgi:hypothetical protein
MAGYIDKNNVQWEHCNVCGDSVRLNDLGYEPPSTEHVHGRDICLTCTNAHPNIESIQPARSWLEVRS